MVIIVGIIFIIIGLLLKTFPPEKQDAFFGYRTELARVNQDTWNEAQKYSSRSFTIIGIIFIPLQFILSKLNVSYESVIYIILISIIIIPLAIELHLRMTFDENGKRRL